MNRLFLLLCSLLLPSLAAGQDQSKYLEGAVPLRDGRVVFTREVAAPGLSRESIFPRVEQMAAERFARQEGSGVVYAGEDDGVVICHGREYLVFAQRALVLDRALVDYQVTYACDNGKCTMEVTRLRYFYGEEKPERYLAEEWITDEHAYDKKRGRLFRGNDKFRAKTVDLVDGLAKLLEESLSALPATRVPTVPAREGFQRLLPSEINGNVISMLMNGSLSLVVDGEEVATRWGGIGYALDRPVVYCFTTAPVAPARYALTWRAAGQWTGFYKEVVFECRPLLRRQLSADDLADESLDREHPLPCLQVGEITAVWVR